MKRFADLVAEALLRVGEIMPWDLRAQVDGGRPPLLLDVREPAEFAAAHIAGSLNVPRGLLEQACEWDFDATEPRLAAARAETVVVICRSGNRSVLAADLLRTMGFAQAVSLKTGVRGWNDFDQPLVDAAGQVVGPDVAAELLAPPVRADQRRPAR